MKKCSQSRQPEGVEAPEHRKLCGSGVLGFRRGKVAFMTSSKTGGAFNNNGFGKISLYRGTDKLYLLSANRTC